MAFGSARKSAKVIAGSVTGTVDADVLLLELVDGGDVGHPPWTVDILDDPVDPAPIAAFGESIAHAELFGDFSADAIVALAFKSLADDLWHENGFTVLPSILQACSTVAHARGQQQIGNMPVEVRN